LPAVAVEISCIICAHLQYIEKYLWVHDSYQDHSINNKLSGDKTYLSIILHNIILIF
jgi:hypothetical protein